LSFWLMRLEGSEGLVCMESSGFWRFFATCVHSSWKIEKWIHTQRRWIHTQGRWIHTQSDFSCPQIGGTEEVDFDPRREFGGWGGDIWTQVVN
jgi:hypothetical protein